MSYRYQPGSSHLAVGSSGGVLTPDAALALRLWPLIDRGAPLPALVEEALRDGLTQLPDLLLFELDARSARVIVRGKTALRVTLVDGSTTQVDGDAVRTWNEQVLTRPVVVSAGPQADKGLPIVRGVVLADGFQWSVADIAERSAVPRPDPAGPVSASKHQATAGSISPRDLAAALLPSETAAPEFISAPKEPHPTSLPDTRIEPIDDSFEHLFESTVMRSVEDAAVRAADESVPRGGIPAALPDVGPDMLTPNPAGPELPASFPNTPSPGTEGRFPALAQAALPTQGDHDGSTIMAGQLAAVLASTGEPPSGVTPQRRPTLVLSTGQSVEVDRGVVIGRRPQIDRVAGSEIPYLVTVPSPQQDISRSHVAVRPSGDGFLAVDLGSTNGSIIRRASGTAQMLRDGAMSDLQFGDVLDLGDGVTAVLRAPS
jgi:hypothetical protein